MKILRKDIFTKAFPALFVSVVVLFSPSVSLAEDFPSKPIIFTIPYSPGGSSDNVARALGQEITKATGQNVIVESRPGGNTIIGTNAMLEKAPDGHSVSIAASSSVIVPQLMDSLPYDFYEDIAPVIRLYGNPHVLVVSEDSPVENLKEFINWISDDKDHATYSSVGTGSSIHLGFERFKKQADIDMLQIPYKGSPAALLAVLTGEVDATFADVGVVLPQIKAGKIRAIAVGSKTRSPFLPDVPTFDEAGLPGFTSETWMGLIANSKVDPAKIERLNELFADALAKPEVQKVLSFQGVEAQPSSPQEFADFLKSESLRFKEIIQSENISLQ